jgi:hypothetical protein
LGVYVTLCSLASSPWGLSDKGPLKMAELKIYLSASLNEKFRRMAMSVHGYGRGSLSKAAEEAFTKWCSEHEHSSIVEKVVGNSETARNRTARETEAHLNPDERESAGQEAKRFGENKPLNSTRSSA